MTQKSEKKLDAMASEHAMNVVLAAEDAARDHEWLGRELGEGGNRRQAGDEGSGE